MDPSSLLEQLRDVHTPDSIGSWPPAIGWVLLVVFITLGISALVWFTIRWYRANAWRRAALKEFKLLKQSYQQSPSPQSLSMIVILLKRCASTVKQNSALLAVTGEQWRLTLQESESPLQTHDLELLTTGHYQASCERLDSSALSRIERWIKDLKSTTKKTYSDNQESSKS